jgi:hypothetical protein|tara:strand:+ start:243 stop:563 length:321 start_codon:yes stop_codon:yes gene_type:complete
MKTALYSIIAISLLALILYLFGYLKIVVSIVLIVSAIMHNSHLEAKAHKAHLNTKEGGREYVKNYVERMMKATETPSDYDDRQAAGRGRRAHGLLEAEISLKQQQR